MSLKNWKVIRVSRQDITKFIEHWHYSKSINGCIADYCYALFDENNIMKGALFYGRLAMANQWKRFVTSPEKLIELRRLCCVDDTPKNVESFLIGRSIKLLSKDWSGDTIVSYADKEFGHCGTIYKASNFKMVGEIKGSKVIIYGDKRYHDKAIRTYYKGKLKPFAVKLRQALESGDAYYKETAGKFTYIYNINDRNRSRVSSKKDKKYE